MIITVGNTKGGVGKTTLAVQLAIYRALAGRDVWLIDGDGKAQRCRHCSRAEAGRVQARLRPVCGRAALPACAAARQVARHHQTQAGGILPRHGRHWFV